MRMNDNARLLHLATLAWPPAHRVSVATAEGRFAFVRMAVSRGLAPVTLAQLHLYLEQCRKSASNVILVLAEQATSPTLHRRR